MAFNTSLDSKGYPVITVGYLPGMAETMKQGLVEGHMSPIRPEYAAAIGQIIVAWSKLEDFLSYFIQEFLKLPDEASAVVYAETSSLQKANIIRGFIHLVQDQDLTDEYDVLLEEFNRLRACRNEIAHGFWHAYDLASKRYVVTRVSSRGYPQFKPKVFTEKSLTEIYLAISSLAASLNSYSGRLNAKKAIEAIRTPPRVRYPAPNPSRGAREQQRSRLEKQARRDCDSQHPNPNRPQDSVSGELPGDPDKGNSG